GCGITQAEANAVGVLCPEIAKSNAAEDVATVIESRATQLEDMQWKAQFGIQDYELVSANGHADLRTSCRVARIATDSYGALRPRAVQGKSAKGAAAAGEKALAQRDVRAGECLLEAQAQAVGPDSVFAEDTFVVRDLRLQAAKVGV